MKKLILIVLISFTATFNGFCIDSKCRCTVNYNASVATAKIIVNQQIDDCQRYNGGEMCYTNVENAYKDKMKTLGQAKADCCKALKCGC
jgi:hypothetical protein